MAKAAIIVESPTKVRTLRNFVGRKYKLLASMGHVRDLPERDLGVQVDDGFTPTYQIIPAQRKAVSALKKALKDVDEVYLATDPDREGEAIAWHLVEALKLKHARRIQFNEITKRAVNEALQEPGEIDMSRVNAQQARRILDRLVGYQISPLLWRLLKQRNLSAGRVQSAALRLICDREREVAAFQPEEYWSVEARLTPEDRDTPFTANVVRRAAEKLEMPDEGAAQDVVGALRVAAFRVSDIARREQRRNAPAPFTTSTLQQQAANQLRFSARKTMFVAQQLYEGVEVGDEGTVGLITYMRTDSTRIAPEARRAAVAFVQSTYGDEFVGPERKDKAAKGAQEAHEAVRPTDVHRRPDDLEASLTADQLALYALIWRRFVASQMAPAVYDVTTVDIEADGYGLRANGRVVKFAGYTRLYEEAADEDKREREDEDGLLPELTEGERLRLLELLPEQHFTQAPPRYSEATLVKALEQHGIGRPSTYAPTIDVLRRRDYVRMQKRRFVPTVLGFVVCDYLKERFAGVVDVEFTAKMEEGLDTVERGEQNWAALVREFYEPLTRDLEAAQKAKPKPLGEKCPDCGGELMELYSARGRFAGCNCYPECTFTRPIEDPAIPQTQSQPLDEECPECGKALAVRQGKNGPFVGCTGYPDCDFTRPLGPNGETDARGSAPPEPTDLECDRCGAPMVIRTGRRGRFYGCSAYPKCRNTKPLAAPGTEERQTASQPPAATSGGGEQTEPPTASERSDVSADMPECEECGETMTIRHGRRGAFLGCRGYPKCRNTKPLPEELRATAAKQRPEAELTDIDCPECGSKLVVRRGKTGRFLGCSTFPKCRHTQSLPSQ